MRPDVYRLQLVLGGAGLAGAVAAPAVAAGSVRVAPAGAHRLTVAGLHFTYPAVNAAAALLLTLAALGAAVLLVAVRAAWRQLSGYRRLIHGLPVAGRLPGHPTVYLLDAAAPMAFCAGWLRPRVYVSNAALERLSEAELHAVLAHEQHHRALRDPLRLAVGNVLCQALFFLPVLRPLPGRYADVAELNADAAAVAAAGGAPLASALLTFGASPGGDVVGISPERVDSLLGRPPAWRLPLPGLVVAFATVAAVIGLVWRASSGASVSATLNLPIASSQPCVLVLALVPVVACLAGAISSRR
jgi:Zn-dependent protease with chaperone function